MAFEMFFRLNENIDSNGGRSYTGKIGELHIVGVVDADGGIAVYPRKWGRETWLARLRKIDGHERFSYAGRFGRFNLFGLQRRGSEAKKIRPYIEVHIAPPVPVD